MNKRLERLLFWIGLLLSWELLCRLHLWPEYIFPPPIAVAQSLLNGFSNGTFWIAIQGSMWRLIKGYIIALIIGIILGVLLAQIRWLKNTLGSLIMGMQTLPSICWLPLALLWFGLNQQAILFVVVMGAVFSITQSTEDGIRNTPPVYVQAARNLGARRLQLYIEVIFPAALPSIISGMKLGWSFAWRSLMAGELLYTLPGLGNLLMMGRELNDMSQVMAVISVIIALGLISDRWMFGIIERQVRERWGL